MVIVVCVTHGAIVGMAVHPKHGLVMCVQPHATPHEFGMHVAVDWYAAGDTPHEVGWHASMVTPPGRQTGPTVNGRHSAGRIVSGITLIPRSFIFGISPPFK